MASTQTKIVRVADQIGDSLVAAQYALWSLRAIHEESKAKPNIDLKRKHLMEQIWCGLFDRLYIKIGSCIETSEGAGNFSTLKNLSITAMGSDADACLTITTAFQELEKFEGIRKWRNKVIAHNDPKFDAMKYYTEHKMHVSEYQEVIDCLFGVLNTMSELTVRKIYIPPTFYNLFAKDAAFLYLQSLN